MQSRERAQSAAPPLTLGAVRMPATVPRRRLPPPAARSQSSASRRARLPRCSVATRRIAERARNQQDGGGSRLHTPVQILNSLAKCHCCFSSLWSTSCSITNDGPRYLSQLLCNSSAYVGSTFECLCLCMAESSWRPVVYRRPSSHAPPSRPLSRGLGPGASVY